MLRQSAVFSGYRLQRFCSLDSIKPSIGIVLNVKPSIDNSFYEELKERWYTDFCHPIALLRKENEIRNPWIKETIERQRGNSQTILDIGCGAGFLTNALALYGHRVTGIDLSPSSLEIARQQDSTSSVQFAQADAHHLPFSENSFDVVCAMDLLEHVEKPFAVIREAARVLKPGGLFFFHTFNRNWLSYLFVIKGVEWWLAQTPRHLHVYHLFIKPKELEHWCHESQIALQELKGLVPQIASLAFWKGFFKRTVDPRMQFRLSPSLKTGYMGFGIKNA